MTLERGENRLLNDNLAAGAPVAGNPVAGNPVAGNPVAGNPVAGNPVAGNPVAGNPVAGNISFQQTSPLEVVSTPTSRDKRAADKSLRRLAERIGPIHLRIRLGVEEEKENALFGQGRNFFHIENWTLMGRLLKHGLNFFQLMPRGKSNARDIRVRHNSIYLKHLPASFHGYTLLHISDSHLDMAEDIPLALIRAVRDVDYDACVWTGDFRGKTHGPYDQALEGLEKVRAHLREPVYAVLGNHDTIRMVPDIEDMNIRMLLNEHVVIEKGNESVYLAGLDDPHFYRADNLEKTADTIPQEASSILLAHTPEIYQHAAFANFDVMLCGHTHGGQICLPGGYPVTLNISCSRQYGRGVWKYRQLQGYTSVGSGACVLDVRFNCPPEITLHHLYRRE